MEILSILERKSIGFNISVGIMLIILVGILDYLTGYEYAFSLFYLVPVFWFAWLMGKWPGIVASVASALSWQAADFLTGHTYSHPVIYVWNSFVRLIIFVITALLLSILRSRLEIEERAARVDYLTGVGNSRYFYDVLQTELNRLVRYQRPFSLAYFDLDNFKRMNDRYGHTTGDQILQTVANLIHERLRKTDTFARLGGDEFVMLLPETGEEAAQAVVSSVFSRLDEEMTRRDWPIGFSVGVVTYNAAPKTLDEVVQRADDLMYKVKSGTKNGVKYGIYPEQPHPEIDGSAGR